MTEPVPAKLTVSTLDPNDDAATQLLQLTARLHAARGDPAAWAVVLRAFRDWCACSDDCCLSTASDLPDAAELEALAGRISLCATYAVGACDALKRNRCAALAPHLHEAARVHRMTLQAALFDYLPPTWILGRDASVKDANVAAQVLAGKTIRLFIVDGWLTPCAPEGGKKLRRTLANLAGEARFTWPGPDGVETTLLLRPLRSGDSIAATLLDGPMAHADLVSHLTQTLLLSARQGELAANLLAGQTLAESARQMGISRHTANEHLAALLHRTGVADRKALVELLLGTVRR